MTIFVKSSITVEINGYTIELTKADAEQLHEQLGKALNKTSPSVIPVPYDAPWTNRDNPWWDRDANKYRVTYSPSTTPYAFTVGDDLSKYSFNYSSVKDSTL